jgi:hypothetical protein
MPITGLQPAALTNPQIYLRRITTFSTHPGLDIGNRRVDGKPQNPRFELALAAVLSSN